MTTKRPRWTGHAAPILPAASMSRTIEFYSSIGFSVFPYSDGGYAMMTSPDQEDVPMLHFILSEDLNPFVSAGMAYISVPDVDSLHAAILATGAISEAMDERGVPHHNTIELRQLWIDGKSLARVSRPWNHPWHFREFALIDPDNNLIRIGQPIPV